MLFKSTLDPVMVKILALFKASIEWPFPLMVTGLGINIPFEKSEVSIVELYL